MGEPTSCPQCGNEFKNVFMHWAMSSECERPAPTEYEQSLIIGMWLAGSDLQFPENAKYPSLVKYSTNRELLEWLADELGLWVKDSKVMEIRSADEQASHLDAGFGGDNNANTLYAVRVRPSKFTRHLRDAAPTDVELPADAARVLYAFRGWVDEEGYGIMFTHPEPDDIVAVLAQNGFEAAAHPMPQYGIYRVRVMAESAQRFAEYVRADESLPGCSEKFDALSRYTS